MKLSGVVLTVCALTVFTFNCESKIKGTKNVKLNTKKDSISYFIGTDIANSLEAIKGELDIDRILKGFNDKLAGSKLLVEREKMMPIMQEFSMNIRKKQEEKNKRIGIENLKAGKEFLAKNKKKKGVITTKSGLQYIVVKKGKGPRVKKTDKVKVHYRGTTIDGKEFDSSYKRGTPTTFPVTGVIKGWTEALLLMNAGSKYKVFVPSELAYGERGAGAKIGPNSTLIFDVNLISIEK